MTLLSNETPRESHQLPSYWEQSASQKCHGTLTQTSPPPGSLLQEQQVVREVSFILSRGSCEACSEYQGAASTPWLCWCSGRCRRWSWGARRGCVHMQAACCLLSAALPPLISPQPGHAHVDSVFKQHTKKNPQRWNSACSLQLHKTLRPGNCTGWLTLSMPSSARAGRPQNKTHDIWLLLQGFQYPVTWHTLSKAFYDMQIFAI